jgi:hypothetical protein
MGKLASFLLGAAVGWAVRATSRHGDRSAREVEVAGPPRRRQGTGGRTTAAGAAPRAEPAARARALVELGVERLRDLAGSGRHNGAR